MKSWRGRAWLLLAVAPAAFGAGCAQFDLGQSNGWPFAAEEEHGEPTQLIAVWTDTVLTRADGPAVRGFGGRLMFYDHQDAQPIKARGTLVVYAYDDSKRQEARVEPDRKYVFRAEDLDDHYSESRIGDSYSVWLPWGPVGGEQKEITLIARFKTAAGNEVVGEPTSNVLPGTVDKPAEKQPAPGVQPYVRQAPDPRVRWAAHQASLLPAGGGNPDDSGLSRRMITTTIPVPPRGILRMPGARVTQVRPRSESSPEPVEPWSAGQQPVEQGPTPAASLPAQDFRPAPAPGLTGCPPPRFPAPDEPSARQGVSRARWKPFPEAWPYGPGPTPPAGSASAAGPSE